MQVFVSPASDSEAQNSLSSLACCFFFPEALLIQVTGTEEHALKASVLISRISRAALPLS